MEAGRGSQLRQLLSVVLRSPLGLREDLLARFATPRHPDRFLEERLLQPKQRTSPLPLRPSRRDMMLLSGGAYPLHYHHTICEQTSRYRGVALYLDVSCSVTCYLPQILGVLRRLRGRLGSIYQFSNQVVETTLEALLDGEIQTTYGTDFDCVAQSILDQGFERAMVITDGYASLSRRLKDELLQRKARLLTILFGQARTCDPLAPLVEVVPLEKVCALRAHNDRGRGQERKLPMKESLSNDMVTLKVDHPRNRCPACRTHLVCDKRRQRHEAA